MGYIQPYFESAEYKKYLKDNWSPVRRRNSGYHDGLSCRTRWKFRPEWFSAHYMSETHPSDKHYGRGFWAGFHNREWDFKKGVVINSPEKD